MSDRIKAKARFVFKAKTLEEWKTQNPVLLAGEHGVVIDGVGMEREKIGDGIRTWNELEWWKVDSPYELALKNGFDGTEKEWLESLKGEAGKDAVIDQTYDSQSENAQSGKAMAGILATLDSKIESTSHNVISTQKNLDENYYTKTEVDNKTIVDQFLNSSSTNAVSGKVVSDLCAQLDTKAQDALNYLIILDNRLTNNYYTKTEIDTLVGDIETLLGGI